MVFAFLLNVVFNCCMNPHDTTPHSDWLLIEQLGGASEVARLLGYPEKGGAQRVHNWKFRGIPADVKLKHPELFLSDLIERAKSSDDAQPPVGDAPEEGDVQPPTAGSDDPAGGGE